MKHQTDWRTNMNAVVKWVFFTADDSKDSLYSLLCVLGTLAVLFLDPCARMPARADDLVIPPPSTCNLIFTIEDECLEPLWGIDVRWLSDDGATIIAGTTDEWGSVILRGIPVKFGGTVKVNMGPLPNPDWGMYLQNWEDEPPPVVTWIVLEANDP